MKISILKLSLILYIFVMTNQGYAQLNITSQNILASKFLEFQQMKNPASMNDILKTHGWLSNRTMFNSESVISWELIGNQQNPETGTYTDSNIDELRYIPLAQNEFRPMVVYLTFDSEAYLDLKNEIIVNLSPIDETNHEGKVMHFTYGNNLQIVEILEMLVEHNGVKQFAVAVYSRVDYDNGFRAKF